MRKSERKYRVIRSQEITDPSCDEMACLLRDLEDYTDSQKKEMRRMAYMIGTLKRFSTKECFAIAGHCDWLLRKNNPSEV